jgi:hypothetical protein
MQVRLSLSRRALGGLAVPLMAVCLSSPSRLSAQPPAGAGTQNTSLPDSPQPKPAATSSGAVQGTSKFVGYITNRSIFFPDIATSEGPLSTGRKFELFVDQSISPAYVLAAGVSAAFNQARDVPKAYGQGWDAYGSRFGENMARASSDSFFSTFLFASVLRQDPRFFPQSNPTLWGSVKYSVKRVFVTPTDSGRNVLNTSGLLGPAATESLAMLYLPRSEQTGAATAERYGTDLAWRFAGNMFKNYWPKFFRSLGMNRLKIIPDPDSPGKSVSTPKN